jgi:hypothetical protein
VYAVASRLFFGGETDETLAAFLDQTHITFPVLWDSGSYGDLDWPEAMSPFPRQALVGPDGTLLYVAAEHRPSELEAAIHDALQGR